MTLPPTREQVLRAIEALYPDANVITKLETIPNAQLHVQGGLLRDIASGTGPKEADMIILVPGTIDEREHLVENALNEAGFTKLGNVRSRNGSNYHYLPPGSSSLESSIDINVHNLDRMQKPMGDFTVNSMYMDLASGELVDPYDGLRDLEHKALRTIQDPATMFKRNPILVFRAIKIMCQLKLVPEPETQKALRSCAHYTHQTMSHIADHPDSLMGEWLLDNMFRGLKYDSTQYFSFLEELGIFGIFIQFLSERIPAADKAHAELAANPFVQQDDSSYEEKLSVFFSVLTRSIANQDFENTFNSILDTWGIRDTKRYHSFGADVYKIMYVGR